MYWVIINHILRLGTISVWALKYTCLLCICFTVGQLNNRTWLFTFSKWKQQTYHPETNIHNIYPVADTTLIESHIKMYKSDFVSITQVLVYISMCYEQIISDHFNQSAQKERERETERKIHMIWNTDRCITHQTKTW